MAVTYTDWLARAREHLAAGRALDALSCFRKAARQRPRALAPFAGIADSLWRLGKPREAIVAWQEAGARMPEHLPTWQAITEAATFIGDDAVAQESAARVLAAAPADRRARFVDACGRLAEAATREAALETLAELVATASRMTVRVPHMARALARALSQCEADDTLPLRRALAAHADALDLALVAHIAPDVPANLLQRRIDAVLATGDPEDLRLLAVSLSRGVDLAATRDALAQRAASRYGELCAARHAADVPLMWPVRTAGERVRMIVLVDTTTIDADDSRWMSLVTALQAIEPRVELSFAAFGDAQRAVDRLQSARLVTARVTQMPEIPDIESARALAAADPDVLLDFTALHRRTGPLLAARPARHVVSGSRVPHIDAPLADACLPVDPRHWPGALAALLDGLPAGTNAASTAGAIQSMLALAIDAHRDGRNADAGAAYDAILREQPAHAPTLHLRGALRRDADDAVGATADFAAALQIAPGDAKSRVALAQLALADHRADFARRLLEEGIARNPGDVSIVRAIGHAALAQRDGASAIEAFAAALARDPFDAETHFNHGVALQMQRYLGDAARAYQRALDLSPALLDAHFNMGVVFDELGETDSAVTALEFVVKSQPARAEAHRTLLDVLSRAGRGAAWMRAFERFERRCPDALGLVANALEYYQYMGDYAKVHRYIDRLARDEFKPASELDLVDSLEQLLYLMLFFDIEPGTQASLYSTYDRAAQRVYGEPIARIAARKPGAIRIGYLSADLRDHVMGKMMLDAVRHHDRTRFAIHFYSTAAAEDAVTQAYRALGDAFESLAGIGDDEAVRRIAAADLDILVDLSTHTRGARPAILARKPARVQITHVASAGALGLSAVDFKLTDRLADLPGNGKFLVETLLPMEGCVYPFRRMTAACDHPFHRAGLRIAADDVVIGAFVTPLKLSRRTTALWKEVLERLPRARLAFSPNADWLRDTYPTLLTAAGIDPSRAIVLPQGRDEAENLARYALVDFVLDPMPFGNVNGTIEPLNMGVPVVTLCGHAHGERTGYSMLTHLGETRTIATSGKEYVEIAVRLANDDVFMRDVRESIRACVASAAWTDARVYARNLEAAYDSALAAAYAESAIEHAIER